MNGPDSISDPVAPKISYIGSYPSARGSALTQLASTRLGSAHDWWCGRWVPLCLRVSWLGADMACQLYMLMSQLCHVDIILIRVGHVGRVNWYSGQVSPFGRKRHVGRVGARGQPPYRRVRPYLTSNFDVVFTSMIVSSSSTQWYCQNTILTTFIFGKKSNTTLNHMLWYQLLGILTGDVLIVAHWRLSTLRHNI
jgi:hypothetical protein